MRLQLRYYTVERGVRPEGVQAADNSLWGSPGALVERFLGVFSESETQCCCVPEVSADASLKNYPLSFCFALFDVDHL